MGINDMLSSINSASKLMEMSDQIARANELIESKQRQRDNALFQTANAGVEQIRLLNQQITLLQQQNDQLQENYKLLKEQYEAAKAEAANDKRVAKKNQIFGWISFASGTLIGIVGVICGIIW